MIRKLVLVSLVASGKAADDKKQDAGYYQDLTKTAPIAGTCGDMKAAYKSFECCGSPNKVTNLQLVPMNQHKSQTPNPCEGTKPAPGSAFDNRPCWEDNVLNAMEQSGTNVTAGYQGSLESTSSGPIMTDYFSAKLCPVNVHWHLGTEHLSVGQYDEHGSGPNSHVYHVDDSGTRRLADEARRGFMCHHYNTSDPRFTTPYKWQHCADMYVGETYEVHWPHSTIGACNTPNQYQTPFYDGVFCNPNRISLEGVDTAKNIGVQAQIFTVVNDEAYYYPDLMRGWIVDGEYGADIAKYTGSTTGTTRNNEICSAYAPITWQVDRKCHLISASSFDKMCADMKSQKDDMSGDLYPHGARVLVADELAANNHNRRA